MIVTRARELRKQIEVGASSMDDENALKFTELFPAWSGETVSYVAGTRVRYGKDLYRVLTNHISQEAWNPVDASGLFAKVLIPDENVIPEWEQPGANNAYKMGDRVMYDGLVYVSLIDNNVWNPSLYPQGWKLVE